MEAPKFLTLVLFGGGKEDGDEDLRLICAAPDLARLHALPRGADDRGHMASHARVTTALLTAWRRALHATPLGTKASQLPCLSDGDVEAAWEGEGREGRRGGGGGGERRGEERKERNDAVGRGAEG